jgi:hypothetical protein
LNDEPGPGAPRPGPCVAELLQADGYCGTTAKWGQPSGCSELDGGVEGERVWMTCRCGARIVRPFDNMEGPA